MKCYENHNFVNEVINRLRQETRNPFDYTVTKLISCPRKMCFKLKGVFPIITDETELIYARGRGHHGVLQVFPKKEIEIVKNSINGNIPIFAHIDMKDERIVEVFTTTKSSNSVPEHDAETAAKVFQVKYDQLRAYCYFINELKGDLLIFFLMGDYNRFDEIFGRKIYVGLRPKLRDFTYEFNKSDLDEVWLRMNSNLDEIELFKKTGELPLVCGSPLECKTCSYAYVCLGNEPIGDKVNELPFTEEALKS